MHLHDCRWSIFKKPSFKRIVLKCVCLTRMSKKQIKLLFPESYKLYCAGKWHIERMTCWCRFKGFQISKMTAFCTIWKWEYNRVHRTKISNWTCLCCPFPGKQLSSCSPFACVATRVTYLYQNHNGIFSYIFIRLKWHLVALFSENSLTAPGILWFNHTNFWRCWK